MVVDDSDGGIVDGGAEGMNPSGQVDVFGIHEEAFVEKSGFAEGIGSQEHEAALMVGDVERSGAVDVAKFVALAVAAHEAGGEEASEQEVERCGEQSHGVERISLSVGDFGLERADGGVGVHVIDKLGEVGRAEVDVGVENQVIRGGGTHQSKS